MREQHPRPTTGRKTIRTVLLSLVLDLLLTAALVLGNYWFVYCQPAASLQFGASTLPQSSITQLPLSHQSAGTADGSAAQEDPAASQPQTLREKFAEHFTATPVSTPDGYSSPNLSIRVSQHTQGSGSDTVTYYVADVYVADMNCFQTAFSGGSYNSGTEEHLSDMSSRLGAILAINGDSYCYNHKHCNGLLIRNATLYRSNPTTQDICVLYADGTMATYGAAGFDPNAAVEQGVLHTWIFGPRLLDDQGKALSSFDTWDYIRKVHPRTAMGYYEPGHYCFVVVDGRQDGYSRGMSLGELAKVFEDLGCAAAYNLDGGHTTFMTLNGQYVNHSYKPSKMVSDCIYFCEPKGALS